MHFNTAQSRSAWTEQEDELLRQAVAKFGDRAWATVANDVPGRSSKSCSDRWRNFLSPDIEHPRKSPFTEWEVAVVVQAQHRYGNNWKAISMLLPGRTNRAVKNLFVGNLKWGARLPEIRNRYLEVNMSLEELLEIKPDHAGGPVRPRPGSTIPAASGSPSSLRAASTSSAGSAWASDITDQPLSGSPASAGTHTHHTDRRKRGEVPDMGAGAGQSPPLSKRRRGAAASPVIMPHHHNHQYMQHGTASYSPNVVPHPGALGPGMTGSPILGMSGGLAGDMSGLASGGGMGPPSRPGNNGGMGTPTLVPNNTGALLAVKQRVSSNGSDPLLLPNLQVMDEGSPSLGPGGGLAGLGGSYSRPGGPMQGRSSMAGLIPGLPSSVIMGGQQQQQQQQHQQHQQQGQQGMLVGRVVSFSSWHPGAAGMPMDAAAMAASSGNGSSSPFAAMAGAVAGGSSGARGHNLSNLNPMRTQQGSALPGGIVPKTEPMQLEGGDCTGNTMGMGMGYMQQHAACWDMGAAHLASQQQQQQLQLHHQQQQQQHQMHTQQHQLDASQQHRQGQQPGGHIPAALGPHVASSLTAAGSGLGLPGSPGLGGNILQDMRSNDSAMLQQMLEQIFDEDDVLSDPHISKLMGTPDHSSGQLQQQQHAVPQASSHHPDSSSGPQGSQAQPQSSQGQGGQHGSSAGGAAASLDCVAATADGALTPRTLMRSSTWPNNTWPEDGQAAAAAPQAGAGAASGGGSFGGHMGLGGHPSGVPLPPRSISATGSGLNPLSGPSGPQAGGPDGSQWGWSGPQAMSGPHSMPGSGPPSSGGMPQQNMMQILCQQLQQENMMLIQRVHNLQNRLASQELPPAAELVVSTDPSAGPSAPAPTPTGVAPPPPVAAPSEAAAAASDNMQSCAAVPSPVAAPGMQGMAAAAAAHPDDDLPRLPPVATRVGGGNSSGGVGSGTAAGWGSGGLGSERGSGQLAGLGSGGLGLGSGGSAGLAGILKNELQSSPGVFTPGQLLDSCMVDSLMPDL